MEATIYAYRHPQEPDENPQTCHFPFAEIVYQQSNKPELGTNLFMYKMEINLTATDTIHKEMAIF